MFDKRGIHCIYATDLELRCNECKFCGYQEGRRVSQIRRTCS